MSLIPKTPVILNTLLVLACASGHTYAQSPADPAYPRAGVRTLPSRQLAALDVPIHPRVAPSPDGRFIAALQTRPDPVLWIVPTDGGDPFAYRKTWSAYHPRWAPSGHRIGFITAMGQPRIWTVEVDPESGRPIDPPRMLIRTLANAFAFSPDGARIALVSSRSTAAGASEIHIVDWESRRTRVLLREDGTIDWLDWAPDGEHIYYGTTPNSPGRPGGRTLVRARLPGGARQRLAEVGEFLGLSLDGTRLLYRPLPDKQASRQVLELSDVDAKPLSRLAAPDGSAPQWGADTTSLLQVRPVGSGNVIVELTLRPE